MSEESETQQDNEAATEQVVEPTIGEDRVEVTKGEALAASPVDDSDDPEDDDRDVRIPRDERDVEAEPSIEDQIRQMAAEPEAVVVEFSAQTLEVTEAFSDEGPEDQAPEPMQQADEAMPLEASSESASDAESDPVLVPSEPAQSKPAAAPAQKPIAKQVPLPAMAAAHDAFSRAIRAHAGAKGLQLKDQSAYLQIMHGETGHKVYVAIASKTREVHIETTLPVAGQFGAVEPKKENGRIAAVLDPAVDDEVELRNVLSLIDLLASGTAGTLPPPKRRAQPAQ